MAQTEFQTENSEKSPFSNLVPPELAAMGKERFDAFVAMQTEQLDKLREANQIWLERIQSEAKLASELASKLTAARSMPEVASAYQEWAQRHMEMVTEDAKRIFADSQKMAEAGARLLANGWRANGHGGSS